MALGFPSDPAPPVGHIVTLNGRDWKYDGTKWVLVGLQITDVEFRQSDPITVDQTFMGSTGPGDPGYLGVVEYGLDIKTLPLLSESDPNPSGTTGDTGGDTGGDDGTGTGTVIVDPTPVIAGTFNVIVVDTGVQNRYFINSVEAPTLEVERGYSYQFEFNTVGHPFWIQYTDNANQYSSIDAYTQGMTGTAMETGTMIWTVEEDAPDVLYYRCQLHTGMGGLITVTGGSDTSIGGVTTPTTTTTGGTTTTTPTPPSSGY